MKKIIGLFVFMSMHVSANDSTGFVATGGVQYLKNKDIQMYSENLFISKKRITVDYEFKNLSKHLVNEIILFPLPKVQNYMDYDYADATGLIDSFKIQVNGQRIQPQVHVRAFLPSNEQEYVHGGDFQADVTNELMACSLTQQELIQPWKGENTDISTSIQQKIQTCKNPRVQKLLKIQDEDLIRWQSQVIYSWKQNFKANSMTRIQHEYAPLVGGSVSLYPEEDEKTYCMDQSFKAGLKKAKSQYAPYQALGYILKTGANWAKPIQNFKLTIERDPNELVSFCWDGQVKKISSAQFQMTEKNFVPKQDLDIIFVRKF